VIGLHALAAGTGEQGEGVGADLRVQLGEVVLAEGGGQVHGGFSERNGSRLEDIEPLSAPFPASR